MAQEKILGNQLNVADVATELAPFQSTNIVEDTTPQLGGDLSVNGYNITAEPAATVTSAADDVTILAPAGGATSGRGGDVHITGGECFGSSYGGYINITAGASTNAPGGINLVGGIGGTSYGGGAIGLRGGKVLGDTSTQGGYLRATGATTTKGGYAIVQGGLGLSGTKAGGPVLITGGGAGSGAGALAGGKIAIEAGDAQNGGDGGTITLQPGKKDVTGNQGTVDIQPAGLTQDAAQLRFIESGAGGASNFVALVAPALITTDAVWELPEAQQTSGDPLGIDLGEYTVATLPAAATYPNCWALATDGGSPDTRTIVRSDGTNWKIVATEGTTITA